MRLALLLVVGGLAAAAQACSGPGARDSMRASEAFAGRTVLAVAFLLASVGLATLRSRRWPTGALAALLALHPIWYVSAGRGDCGGSLRQLSFVDITVAIVVSWIAILPFLVQLQARTCRRRP